MRAYDSIGRYGGDEMLVVLPDSTTGNLEQIARRLPECISRKPISAQSKRLKITISLGGASTTSFPGISPKDLIKKSDEALYEAKRKGRNRC